MILQNDWLCTLAQWVVQNRLLPQYIDKDSINLSTRPYLTGVSQMSRPPQLHKVECIVLYSRHKLAYAYKSTVSDGGKANSKFAEIIFRSIATFSQNYASVAAGS